MFDLDEKVWTAAVQLESRQGSLCDVVREELGSGNISTEPGERNFSRARKGLQSTTPEEMQKNRSTLCR